MASKELWQLQRMLTELETAFAAPGMPELNYYDIESELCDLIKEKTREEIRARFIDLNISALCQTLGLVNSAIKQKHETSPERQGFEVKDGWMQKAIENTGSLGGETDVEVLESVNAVVGHVTDRHFKMPDGLKDVTSSEPFAQAVAKKKRTRKPKGEI